MYLLTAARYFAISQEELEEMIRDAAEKEQTASDLHKQADRVRLPE